MDIIITTFHQEPLEAIYYWEKMKLDQIPDLKFHEVYMKKTCMSNPVKKIITARVVPSLFKELAVLSATTVRMSVIDQEELRPYWKSEKSQIFLGNQQAIFYKFFKDFTNH